MEPVEAVERRPERDLRVQSPDLEGGARVHFADFKSLYKIIWVERKITPVCDVNFPKMEERAQRSRRDPFFKKVV